MAIRRTYHIYTRRTPSGKTVRGTSIDTQVTPSAGSKSTVIVYDPEVDRTQTVALTPETEKVIELGRQETIRQRNIKTQKQTAKTILEQKGGYNVTIGQQDELVFKTKSGEEKRVFIGQKGVTGELAIKGKITGQEKYDVAQGSKIQRAVAFETTDTQYIPVQNTQSFVQKIDYPYGSSRQKVSIMQLREKQDTARWLQWKGSKEAMLFPAKYERGVSEFYKGTRDYAISSGTGTAKLVYAPNFRRFGTETYAERWFGIPMNKMFKVKGKIYNDPDVQTAVSTYAFIGFAPILPKTAIAAGTIYGGYQLRRGLFGQYKSKRELGRITTDVALAVAPTIYFGKRAGKGIKIKLGELYTTSQQQAMYTKYKGSAWTLNKFTPSEVTYKLDGYKIRGATVEMKPTGSFPVVERSTGAVLTERQTQLFPKNYDVYTDFVPAMLESGKPVQGLQTEFWLTKRRTPIPTFGKITESGKFVSSVTPSKQMTLFATTESGSGVSRYGKLISTTPSQITPTTKSRTFTLSKLIPTKMFASKRGQVGFSTYKERGTYGSMEWGTGTRIKLPSTKTGTPTGTGFKYRSRQYENIFVAGDFRTDFVNRYKTKTFSDYDVFTGRRRKNIIWEDTSRIILPKLGQFPKQRQRQRQTTRQTTTVIPFLITPTRPDSPIPTTRRPPPKKPPPKITPQIKIPKIIKTQRKKKSSKGIAGIKPTRQYRYTASIRPAQFGQYGTRPKTMTGFAPRFLIKGGI